MQRLLTEEGFKGLLVFAREVLIRKEEQAIAMRKNVRGEVE